MKELFENLNTSSNVDYLLDTCFTIHTFSKNNVKKLVSFCENNNVGISSFNFEELDHVHHHLRGELNHHLRNFLKKKIVYYVPVDVHPGNQLQEKEYVQKFDENILRIVPDPSDAVLFVLALKLKAHILTKDKHHIFTAVSENYSQQFGVEVLKEFP